MPEQSKIDFIIPTHHGLSFTTALLKEAAKDTSWLRHTFYFIFNSTAMREKEDLENWVQQNGHLLLPTVKAYLAPPQATKNTNMLRQLGLAYGQNRFVYFQDDDDPLPKNLDACLKILLKNPECPAVYGLTETYTHLDRLIERFPNGVYDEETAPNLIKGVKIFPTYTNALSALFRRHVFDKVVIDDGRTYKVCGINSFVVRFFTAYSNIKAIAQVIRREKQNPQHTYSPVFEENRRLLLAEDISNWQTYVASPAIRAFHENIRHELEEGTVTTYRDITARIEEALDLGTFDAELS